MWYSLTTVPGGLTGIGTTTVSGLVTLMVGFGGVPAVHSTTGTTAHPPTISSGETVIHTLPMGLPVIHRIKPADLVPGPVTGRNHRSNRATMTVADVAILGATT